VDITPYDAVTCHDSTENLIFRLGRLYLCDLFQRNDFARSCASPGANTPLPTDVAYPHRFGKMSLASVNEIAAPDPYGFLDGTDTRLKDWSDA